MRRVSQIKEGEDIVGARTRVKVVKNKLAPPFRQVEFDIMYDEGISIAGEVLDMAVENALIDKSGAWYSYGDERIGQGRENSKRFLKENPDILDELRNRLLEMKGIALTAASKKGDDTADLPESGD